MSIAVYDALNTAIYQAVREQPSPDHSLDEYLCTLWMLAYEYHQQPTLPAQQFVDLLARALVTQAPPISPPSPVTLTLALPVFRTPSWALLETSPRSSTCPETIPLASTAG